MKLVSFERDGGAGFGCLVASGVLDLGRALASPDVTSQPESYRTLADAIGGGEAALQAAAALGARAAALDEALAPFSYEEGSVKIVAPLRNASKVVAIGRNYRDHLAEADIEAPDFPRLFPKWPSTVIGPGDAIIKPAMTSQLDWEIELGVVIGRRASRVSEADAMDYVVGYTIINDVSARDIQNSKPEQLALGKNFRTFTPMGNWVVTRDEVPDVDNIGLRMSLNGEVMQDSSTKYMIFNVPRLIAFLSGVLDLEPGDVISSGTPSGVGVTRQPPVFLHGGDQLHMELLVDGATVCELSNNVIEEN